MAQIGSKGLVDDGSSGLTVAGGISAGGGVLSQYQATTALTLAASGTVAVVQPGFYFVPSTGSASSTGIMGGFFTGTLPQPQAWPGATLMFVENGSGFDWLLSGSSKIVNKAFFAFPSGSRIGAPLATMAGGQITMTGTGSMISLTSMSTVWLVDYLSGTATVAGQNA